VSIVSLTAMKARRSRTGADQALAAKAAFAAAAEESAPAKKTFTEAMATVTAYVPTEIIAVYTFVIASLERAGLAVSWAFLAATPVFVWLVYAARCVEEQKPIPWSWKGWPYWEAISASIAFAAWATALPNSPFINAQWIKDKASWVEPEHGAIALAIVSVLLPLVGVLANRRQRRQ
jgi:hypothetical protein